VAGIDPSSNRGGTAKVKAFAPGWGRGFFVGVRLRRPSNFSAQVNAYLFWIVTAVDKTKPMSIFHIFRERIKGLHHASTTSNNKLATD
jgi:hypothetical protein